MKVPNHAPSEVKVYCGHKCVGTVYEINYKEKYLIVDVPRGTMSFLIQLPLEVLKVATPRVGRTVYLSITEEELIHKYPVIPRPGEQQEAS